MSKIPYDLSKVKALVFDIDGVLSPSTVPMATDGEPQRMVNVKDGYALHLAAKCGFKIAVISGARPEYLRNRFTNLGIKDVYLDTMTKRPVMEKWMADNGLRAEEVIYFGDDIPDLPAMALAGLAVAPADADSTVKTKAGYIAVAKGGYGVAREVIEELLICQGYWLDEEKSYSW